MYGVWSTQELRAAEEAVLARTPEGGLMRRAAHAVATRAAALLAEHVGAVAGRRVVLLVGAGDNGGDALWAGYELRRRGVAVTAVLLRPERAHPTGLAALRRARGQVVTEAAFDGVAAVRAADLVVDGVVGISARGALRPDAAALVAAAADAQVPVLAVDLPSGVDPDTGHIGGPAVTATETVTFGAHKPVHALARHACGRVHLVDIGLLPELGEPRLVVLEPADVGERWPVPGPRDDKYTQGVVGVAAGSATYPGAAVLATGGAVLATSGMVRYAGSAADGVRGHWPEVIATGSVADAGRTQAWVVGPGIGTGIAGRETLAAVLDRGVPVCADADAITLLAGDEDLRDAAAEVPLVLTPHDREFARIAGEVSEDRVGAARRAAARLRCTVLLKGHSTVVARPDGRALVHPATSSWPATAGSGDVLSGIVGALLAAGLDPWWAAGCAVHVHALAAALAAQDAPVPSSHLVRAIPEAVRSVRAATRAQAGMVVGSPTSPAAASSRRS